MSSDSMVCLVVVAVTLECWFYFIKRIVLCHKNKGADAEAVKRTKFITGMMGVMSAVLLVPSVLSVIYFRG